MKWAKLHNNFLSGSMTVTLCTYMVIKNLLMFVSEERLRMGNVCEWEIFTSGKYILKRSGVWSSRSNACALTFKAKSKIRRKQSADIFLSRCLNVLNAQEEGRSASYHQLSYCLNLLQFECFEEERRVSANYHQANNSSLPLQLKQQQQQQQQQQQ